MIDHSLDAVLHQNDLPVKKITQGIVSQLQVSQQLCFMDGLELVNSFMLDNHTTFDNRIDSVPSADLQPIINNLQGHFRGYLKTSFLELKRVALAVD